MPLLPFVYIVTICNLTKQDYKSYNVYKSSKRDLGGGDIVSIDVMRARHMHHGTKLTCSIVHDGNTWTVKSSAVDPFKYARLYTRIERIANALESG